MPPTRMKVRSCSHKLLCNGKGRGSPGFAFRLKSTCNCSPWAERNSSKLKGYIYKERILPTPNDDSSSSVNSRSEPAATTCSSGYSSLKYRRYIIACLETCISSMNSKVLPASIGIASVALNLLHVSFTSMFSVNKSARNGCFSRFTST